jgi:serine/threonine-protein kinase
MIHAQSRGLRAHRDVKPSNCLLTNDGTLKITDFGLSKLGIVSNSGVTRISLSAPTNVERGSVFDGTPEYMAPEQFLGSHADVRSDIYSFGVMFFEMLRGTRPFVATSPEELAALHLHKNPPRLKNRNRQVDELVAECLAKNPNDRPQDFTMVRERLSELYEQVAATPAPTRVTGIPFNVRDDRQGR